METDKPFRRFFEQESRVLPVSMEDKVRRDLGALWDQLPPQSLNHDENAYLRAS
jgi:hypothetical protein